jgi:hypothetical protein
VLKSLRELYGAGDEKTRVRAAGTAAASTSAATGAPSKSSGSSNSSSSAAAPQVQSPVKDEATALSEAIPRFYFKVCTALHCTALHCTALHCTARHCTAALR